MRRRVFVTGMGCLSGLAQGVEATWEALLAGKDATRPFRRAFAAAPELEAVGEAVWMDPPDAGAFNARFPPRLLTQMDPSAIFAVLPAFEALAQAGLLDRPELLEQAAVLIGCGAGGLNAIEEAYQRLFLQRAKSIHPLTIPRQMTSAPAGQVSMVFGTRGPSFSIASACASSAHAIAEAAEMIRTGRCDIAIAGGAETPLTFASWHAWNALKVTARSRCRPFSAGRDGMVLGEGGAALILESEAHAAARGAAPLAELLGAGASSDAHHITQPDEAGAAAAMRAALADAGVPADTPMLISSHGTGTLLNDRNEAAALRQVFGPALDHSLVIATKSAHGHLCGGVGALELVIGILALRRGLAPPVLNYLGPDPECDLPLPLGAPRPIAYRTLLSSSFAFGGMNAALVARLPDEINLG